MSRLADLKGSADSREEVLSDYRVYHLTGQEWIRYLLEGTAVCAVTAYVFYRSFLAFVLMLPAGMLRPFFKRRELCRRRKEELRLQFKESWLRRWLQAIRWKMRLLRACAIWKNNTEKKG